MIDPAHQSQSEPDPCETCAYARRDTTEAGIACINCTNGSEWKKPRGFETTRGQYALLLVFVILLVGLFCYWGSVVIE